MRENGYIHMAFSFFIFWLNKVCSLFNLQYMYVGAHYLLVARQTEYVVFIHECVSNCPLLFRIRTLNLISLSHRTKFFPVDLNLPLNMVCILEPLFDILTHLSLHV